MSFGPQSTLKLNLDGIGTLPVIRSSNVLSQIRPEESKRIINRAKTAESDRNTAQSNLQNSIANNQHSSCQGLVTPIGQSRPTCSEETPNYFQSFIEANRIYDETKIIRRDYLNDVEIKPNVFIVVSLDGDNANREPLFFTKVFRENTNPFIRESKENIPIGLLAHGMWGHLLLNSSTRTPYTPNAIYFSIYHDIGEDQETCKTTWTRETPRRDYFIGKARLPFSYLMTNGCPTLHELQVLDSRDMPITDCILRVKSQVSTAIPLHGTLSHGVPLTIDGIGCGEPDIPCACGRNCGEPRNIQASHSVIHRHTHRKCSCKRRTKHKVNF